MTQKIFDILYQINCEGIENGIWSIYDFKTETDTIGFFGTRENKLLKGKYICLYVDANDTYAYIKTETADLMLTIDNDTPYPTALMLWKA